MATCASQPNPKKKFSTEKQNCKPPNMEVLNVGAEIWAVLGTVITPLSLSFFSEFSGDVYGPTG